MSTLKHRMLHRAVSTLGHDATVVGVETLSPNLRNIRLRSDVIGRQSWSPGDKIKLHVGQGLLRSYTPARVDIDSGSMDVIVHLHGRGPGSAWASAVRPGDPASFLGPARSLISNVEDAIPWALVLGDETAVGLALALCDSLPSGTEPLGALELAPEDCVAVDRLGLPLQAVARDGEPGEALGNWLAQAWIPGGNGVAWVSGEASSAVTMRMELLSRGIPRRQIRVKPYWSVRGSAHRKRLEKTALVA